ncbi:Uncharacterized protein Rs2_21457 [Raphanus sativus]|nr:Uncharacterized protein Rs2_21457 [Raphanus sativus]
MIRDEDYTKEREIEYSCFRREEEHTTHVSHPFIPADHAITDTYSYSEDYGESSSLNHISRADKDKSIDINIIRSIDTNINTIDNHHSTSIDRSPTAERDDWQAHSYSIFALEAVSSSQHLEEYDEVCEEDELQISQVFLLKIDFHTILMESEH